MYSSRGKRETFLVEADKSLTPIAFQDLKKGDKFSLKQDGEFVEYPKGNTIFKAESNPYLNDDGIYEIQTLYFEMGSPNASRN